MRAERETARSLSHCSYVFPPRCRQVCPFACAAAGDSDQGVLMYKACKIAFVVAALSLLPAQAQARPHHNHHRLQYLPQSMTILATDERVVGRRPSGCPNSFCGCEASLYRFGRVIPELNLAANWRHFPRTAPSPGMAAVRSGHVMILQQHVAGNVWYVHDGNSGGHLTREHARSIAGYMIVDPGAASSSLSFAGWRQPSPSYGWRSRAMPRSFM
jgi:hypothetical protein